MDRRKFLIAGIALAGTGTNVAVARAAGLRLDIEGNRITHVTLTPKSSDKWEIAFKPKRSFRILQVTDTHFSSTDEKDRRTVVTLDALIRSTNPDLIVHTGDFVNNDSEDPVNWGGVDYFNRMKRHGHFVSAITTIQCLGLRKLVSRGLPRIFE